MNQQGIYLPNYKRLLPKLNCPLCGNELKELRIIGQIGPEIEIAWVCNCTKFKELKLLANG